MNHVISARKPRQHHNVVGRYSNYASGVFQELPATDDKTDLPADYYSSGSSSGSSFNWGDFFKNLFSSATSITTGIWGNTANAQVAAYNTMYEQEKRTNTILWVVIGLVVALGVLIVIRKTK